MKKQLREDPSSILLPAATESHINPPPPPQNINMQTVRVFSLTSVDVIKGMGLILRSDFNVVCHIRGWLGGNVSGAGDEGIHRRPV